MKHYNPTLNKSMSDTFNLKGESTDDILETIVPIVIVEPKMDFLITGTSTVSASTASIITTPADKDLFIVSATLTMEKDAANDNTNCSLDVVIDNVVKPLINFRNLTLTASHKELCVTLPKPLKIDRNSTVRLNAAFAAGNLTRSGTIIGFTQETVKNT